METLHAYSKKYNLGASDSLYESIIKVAEEHNLFDGEIYSLYNQVSAVFNKLPFIETMFSAMQNYSGNQALKKVTIDLFKYYKQRVNLNNYKIVLNEEVMTPITEEVINDLA
jgi:hypothetical protein